MHKIHTWILIAQIALFFIQLAVLTLPWWMLRDDHQDREPWRDPKNYGRTPWGDPKPPDDQE